MKGKKKNIILALVFISSIVLFFFGLLLIKKGFNNYLTDSVVYEEKSDIDYRVFLKENHFFETPYLPKNQVYITSLIDKIDVDLKYDLTFANARSGSYSYTIKGLISADLQTGNSNYWQKEYVLKEGVVENFENKNLVSITENLSIDYDTYNDLLMEFKKEYGLSINGYLKIFLYITTGLDSEFTDEKIVKESVMSLSIPLTKATIEVPIEIKAPNEKSILSTGMIHSDDTKYNILKISGFSLMGISAIAAVLSVLLFVKSKEKQYYYIKKVNNILKTYDSIIVNVKNIPSLKDLKVIDVSEFNELLDAHSEVRLPINYCDYDDRAEFVLFNDLMAWRYTIEKEETYEKK